MGINNNNNNGNSNSNGANTVVGTLSPPLLSSMSNRNRSRSPTPKPVVSFKNVVGGTTHEHVQVNNYVVNLLYTIFVVKSVDNLPTARTMKHNLS